MRRNPGSARPSSRRRPGRPAGRNADQREALLEAALACYGEVGIEAASVRRIAAQAGVTPAMVHYYFGGKERLRDAVISERLMPAVALLRDGLASAADDPRALVEAFVRGLSTAVDRYPWLPSLWVREVLSEGGALRELLISRLSPEVPLLAAKRLAEAQRKGALNPALDPRLLVVSLVGLTMFPVAAAPIWRRIFDADDVDGEALCRHTLALLDDGLGGGHAR